MREHLLQDSNSSNPKWLKRPSQTSLLNKMRLKLFPMHPRCLAMEVPRTQSCKQLRSKQLLSSSHLSQARLKRASRRWPQLSSTTWLTRLRRSPSSRSHDSSRRLSRQRKAQVPLCCSTTTSRRATLDSLATQACSRECRNLCRASTASQTW